MKQTVPEATSRSGGLVSELLPLAWQKRLNELAVKAGTDGQLILALLAMDKLCERMLNEEGTARNELARLLFETIGSRFLTKEMATDVATSLTKKAGKLAAVQAPEPKTNDANTPETLERLSQAVLFNTGIQIRTPAGQWFPVSPDLFRKTVAKITGGLEPEELSERLGIEKLSVEARRRFGLNRSTPDTQVLAAAILLAAEYAERKNQEELFRESSP